MLDVMQLELEQPIEWQPPPQELHLKPNEVYLWCADLATQTFSLEFLQTTLSKDERNRAQRFRFQQDQTRYTVARGCLRLILGRYLNVAAASLRFGYGAQGKPWLMDERGAPHALQFNVAHSGELILYALSWQQEVGIDVELIRVETSYETIAKQFFSPAEVAALRSLPLAEQPQAFFNCWTRKEAYLKARGEGLSFPLDGFAVSLDSQSPVTLQVYKSPDERNRWRLYHLNPKRQYAGAVAAAGQQHTFQYFSTRGLS